jgi:hypothetical protein
MNLAVLQKATLDARARTGRRIGTQVKAGRLRVIEYDQAYTVTPLTDWLVFDAALKVIESF